MGAPSRGRAVQKKSLDEYLIAQVKRGEKTAFNILMLRYQQKVLKIIGRYVKDPNEALDVTQEAFIRVYRALDSFRGASSFYTWLFRIAINTAKNHEMAKSRRPPDIDIDYHDAERQEEHKYLNENASPENNLFCDELQNIVLETMQNLPEELRHAVLLREMDGLSYEQISTLMDCPVGTVRSRIFRARELIDSKIDPFLQEK